MTKKTDQKVKLGIFGGSFDPVHLGHVLLAQECWYQLGLERVIFVPSHISPFKKGAFSAEASDRLNMLRLALSKDNRFCISTFEIDKGGVSYTVDTLKEVSEKYNSSAELFFLGGTDSIATSDKWKDIDRIIDLARLVAVRRRGTDVPGRIRERNVKVIDMPLVDISSTMIRERVKTRRPIDYLVAASVSDYIRNKGLYRDCSS